MDQMLFKEHAVLSPLLDRHIANWSAGCLQTPGQSTRQRSALALRLSFCRSLGCGCSIGDECIPELVIEPTQRYDMTATFTPKRNQVIRTTSVILT